MNVRLPKPLHGWRVFAGEVGIIVIGVLVALGAQQLVEDWQWRNEARAFSKAIKYELGRDIGVYRASLQREPCAKRRLADLERLLADSQAGRQDRLARKIGSPNSFSLYFSVWDNKGAEVTAHLPHDVRVGYGEMYDEFRNYDGVSTGRRDVWNDLAQFDQGEPLDHGDRMRLRALLNRAEGIENILRPNYDYILNLARPLGIKAVADPQNVQSAPNDSFCRPLLAS